MAPALSPANLRKYQELRRRYATDHTYRVVTDLYRNHHGEGVVAAHFYAQHDVEKYTVVKGQAAVFAPIAAGYDHTERAFLLERGVKPL